MTVLNAEAGQADADDVDLTGIRRTTPEIQENEKTAQENHWTVLAIAQNAVDRSAETERKHRTAVMTLNDVVVDVVVDRHLLDGGGVSSDVAASR